VKRWKKGPITVVYHSTSSFRLVSQISCCIHSVLFWSDLCTQEHWDHDTAEDSQEQWERLVWEWQKLTLIKRWVCPSFPRWIKIQKG
jgi:hypothetical protein